MIQPGIHPTRRCPPPYVSLADRAGVHLAQLGGAVRNSLPFHGAVRPLLGAARSEAEGSPPSCWPPEGGYTEYVPVLLPSIAEIVDIDT